MAGTVFTDIGVVLDGWIAGCGKIILCCQRDIHIRSSNTLVIIVRRYAHAMGTLISTSEGERRETLSRLRRPTEIEDDCRAAADQPPTERAGLNSGPLGAAPPMLSMGLYSTTR